MDDPSKVAVKRVALLVETSRGFGRGLLHGIAHWMRERGAWSTFVGESELDDQPPEWLGRSHFDGVISRQLPERLQAWAQDGRIPVVNLRDSSPKSDSPGIFPDDFLVGQMAADHLYDRGYRSFGFCGSPAHWSRRRRDGFQARVEGLGCQLSVYEQRAEKAGPSLLNDRDEISRWVTSLPRPVGIMAANDPRGLQVLDACHAVELRVPGEVGIVGVDDDTVFCELATPTLSSVRQDLETLGVTAAAILDAAMRGAPDSVRQRILVPPVSVAVRGSSDAFVIADEDVRKALMLIRGQACRGISIEEVASHTVLTRRTLERRFQRILGVTIHEEILRTKVENARRILVDEDLKLEVVATRCGFSSVPHLCKVFKEATGQRPGDFRRLQRRPSPTGR